MTIFIVVEHEAYEGQKIIGVFLSLTAAMNGEVDWISDEEEDYYAPPGVVNVWWRPSLYSWREIIYEVPVDFKWEWDCPSCGVHVSSKVVNR